MQLVFDNFEVFYNNDNCQSAGYDTSLFELGHITVPFFMKDVLDVLNSVSALMTTKS